MLPLDHVVAFSALLFCVGAVGAITRRSLLVFLLSVQVMFNAVCIALVAFNRHWAEFAQRGAESLAAKSVGDASLLDGQALALVVIVLATLQLALGIGLAVALLRNRDSLNLEDLSTPRW